MENDLEFTSNQSKLPQTTPQSRNELASKASDLISSQQTHISDMSTRFSNAVDDAKLHVLQEAALNDDKFISDFEKQLKEATIRLAEVEQEKASTERARVELARKNVEYEKELTETRRKLNEYQQTQDKWANKQKAREFHYNGVKNVMTCVGITEPMCIPLLYLLFPFALVFFLIKSVIIATFGNLLCGAVDANRPKAMKGFLWTVLAAFTLCIAAIAIWLILKYFIL